MISASAAGMPVLTASISATISWPLGVVGVTLVEHHLLIDAQVAPTEACSSVANSASGRSACLSVIRSAPVSRVRRARYNGSCLPLRWRCRS